MKMIYHFSNENRHKKAQTLGIIKRITSSVFIVIIAFMFIGCSGSGGSGESATGVTSSLIEGVFIDSPVEGLNYQTETHVGVTDVNGRFICFEGEMITFMIGDVMLGQAMASDIITPLDFLDKSEQTYDVTNSMVTNQGRFLQSLDADGDPDNGITITDEVRNEVNGRMIDFNQSIEDFENNPNVVACFDVFNGLNIPHNNMPWRLTSAEDAQRHMTTYMGEYMPGYMNGYMDGNMHMDNHMNFNNTVDDENIDHPMNGYRDNNMDNYMGMCW